MTAAGLAELTSKALKICPALGGLEVEESWAGLRPTTPDFLPVLGTTPWSNLYVAGTPYFLILSWEEWNTGFGEAEVECLWECWSDDDVV